ncbi:MAG: glycosyl hydrolase family 18 protein [Chloroflexota bacterium]|nr:glycosyl hydrolase family 18 protein [Chloroflexota bacterium]
MPAPTETRPSERLARNGPEVTIWAPYVSVLEQRTLSENSDVIGEVNFFWYELTGDGEIVGSIQSSQGLKTAREAGLRIVPSIVNRGFNRDSVAAIIHDEARRAAHIAEIVALVMENDFDGIDIDYESLYAEDRDAFSLFVEELAAAVHAREKLLSIAVHPKTDEQGSWGGPLAQDWQRLGAAVDEFKIMTYDYHHGASEAGSIAPLTWVDAVLTYASTQVPPQKTYAGIPLYGYNWTGSHGKSIDWQRAMRTAGTYDANIQRDDSGEAWFTYGPDDRHTVHVGDAKGVETRLAFILAQHPDLAGIAIWRLGGEDPAIWPVIRETIASMH